MKSQVLPGGTVHSLPDDLRRTIVDRPKMLTAWLDITPLARNEFICWVISPKQAETRTRRIRIAQSKLESGERRPCCWSGCPHRERNGK